MSCSDGAEKNCSRLDFLATPYLGNAKKGVQKPMCLLDKAAVGDCH